MWEKLKDGFWMVVFLGVIVLIGIIAALLLHGAAWLSIKVYPILVILFSIAFIVSLLFFLPMSFIRRTRPWAATGLLIASYIFGLTLWVWGFLLALSIWGMWGVFIGIMLGGVGVVPIAMLATLFHAMWIEFFGLIFHLLLVFGTRAYAFYVGEKAENDMYKQVEVLPSTE